MKVKRTLRLILFLYISLGFLYALTTPVFEASDELWHYPMVRHLADGNALPVQVFDPAQAGPWKQEASQPPLYYYLGAALTFWVDASDMEEVRWLNPHVDNGVITPDGNTNLIVHDPSVDPWQGTLLAVRIVRLFSVLLGAITVYLTFRIANEVIPKRVEIAMGATAVQAFLPMFLFISGAVNNDNLAMPLSSLALLLMIRAVRYEMGGVITWLKLGVVVGLALLTKEGTFGLLPIAFGTIVISLWQQQSRQLSDGLIEESRSLWILFPKMLIQALSMMVTLLVPVAAISGWWYVRNVRLYDDWLGWSAFIAVLGQRAQPASLVQLWGERWGFLMSYWGLFGGVNVPMWSWIYQLLNGLLLVSVAGFAIYLFRDVNSWRAGMAKRRVQPRTILTDILDLVEARFGLVVCLLFSLAVILGLIQWATTTWSSQGRLVFTAISALNILMTLGLLGTLPPRWSRWAATGLGALMFVIAAAAPLVWIRPAYQAETYMPKRLPHRTSSQFDFSEQPGGPATLRLAGYGLIQEDDDDFLPGDALDLVLWWDTLAPVTRDWSVFVHLNDVVLDVPMAQRDMYHGQGLRPTRLLAVGERIANYYHLRIPDTVVAPSLLELKVGLYDFSTGERMQLATGDDAANLTRLSIVPSAGQYPNPARVNFGNQLELVGWEVTSQLADPGQLVELKLYWRPRQALEVDYTVFAQIVGEDTTRWAHKDLSPSGGTTTWPSGEVQIINVPLLLANETPAAVYPIHIGLYTRTEEGGFLRLQTVTDDGRITQDDFLLLTQIRVR